MKSRSWQLPVLMLLVACVSCSDKGGSEPESATSKSQSASSGPAALPEVQPEDLTRLVDLVVANANDMQRAEFDPKALAASLGSDPQKHFEWVRDHTWWAPYRGLLRGAKGVMLDRVGSNLDRAVLLGELLRQSGHTVRIAHAQLPEGRARELIAKLPPIPDQRLSAVERKPVSDERQKATEALMPGIDKVLAEHAARYKRHESEARTLIRSQTDQLLAAVRDVAPRGAADDRSAIAALRDHWWVERQENGTWIAMDVLPADARLGETLADASLNADWRKDQDAPSIPVSEWHSVQIRVVVERYQGGATTESTVLETTIRPVDVLERSVTLTHVPRPWPEVLPDSEADANAVKNAALWVREWVPFLRIGEEIVAQSGFSESGDLVSISRDSVTGLATGGGRGFGDFGSALTDAEEVEAYVTAEWIDYEIRVPGESSQRLRRPVFDLLGPSQRLAKAAGFEVNSDARKLERFEALWSPTLILLQPSEYTPEFVVHLMSASLVAHQAAFRQLAQESDPAKAKALASDILNKMDFWGPLPDLAVWRTALSSQPSNWFIDRPNILNYRVGQAVSGSDQVSLRQTIDVSANSIGVRRGATRNPFEVRLGQGVADTVGEMLVLGADVHKADNTASIFSMAGSTADHSTVIKPRDTAAIQQLNLPPDAAAWLSENVGSGAMAVVLKEPVVLGDRDRVGWWRIDPASGETVGVMDSGLHMVVIDNAILRLMSTIVTIWAVSGPIIYNQVQRYPPGSAPYNTVTQLLRDRALMQRVLDKLTAIYLQMGG